MDSVDVSQDDKECGLVPVCPFCFSKEMRKYGIYRYAGTARQKWMCEHCEGVTAYPLRRKPKRRPRRLR